MTNLVQLTQQVPVQGVQPTQAVYALNANPYGAGHQVDGDTTDFQGQIDNLAARNYAKSSSMEPIGAMLRSAVEYFGSWASWIHQATQFPGAMAAEQESSIPVTYVGQNPHKGSRLEEFEVVLNWHANHPQDKDGLSKYVRNVIVYNLEDLPSDIAKLRSQESRTEWKNLILTTDGTLYVEQSVMASELSTFLTTRSPTAKPDQNRMAEDPVISAGKGRTGGEL